MFNKKSLKSKHFLTKVLSIIIIFSFLTEVVYAENFQIVSSTISSSVNNFVDKMPYNENGYSGVLGKDGDPEMRVVSGEFIPGESKQITNEPHYTGSSIPSETWLYVRDGYSGTLTRVSYENNPYEEDMGTDVPVPRDFYKQWSNHGTNYYDENGTFLRTTWDNPAPETYHIDEDGYVGELPRTDTIEGTWEVTETWPNGNPKTKEATFVGIYSGRLIKYKHEENWVMVDHYTGYYSGTVYTADVDTRVWEYVQRYRGGVYTKELEEQNYGNPINTECVGEPVNIVTGNYYATDLDLRIPDRGVPIEIIRYYNSLDDRTGVLGKGWRFSYESTLTEESSTGDTKIVYPDGHTVIFRPVSGTNEYSTPESIFDKLLKNADNTYTLRLQSKLTYKYNNNGKLSSITDKNGNELSLQYDGSGRLVLITGASGKSLNLTYENGKIKTITDPAGRTIIYTYDQSNNLSKVKGIGEGTTTYEYVAQGIKSITDQNGKKFIENEYDAFGRIIRQYDEEDNETQYIYDDANLENTCIFASTQSITKYKYNENLFISKKTFADNTFEEYTYDQWGNRNSIKDRNGNTTFFTFDARGNILTMTSPAPFNYVTNYTYDTQDNLTKISTPGGALTDFEYDSHSNLKKTTVKIDSTVNASTNYNYDEYGRIASITDAENNTTLFKYLNDDNPIKITDPEGLSVHFGYDVLGRKSQITTYYGTSNIYYNLNDKIEKIIDPNGNIIRMKYDAMGNLIKLIQPEQYNEAADDGTGYTFNYDAMDRLIYEIDPLGNVSALKYSQLGEKIKEVNPNYYNPATNDGLGTGFEYDETGRIIRVVNPSGEKSRIMYDPVGNKTKIIDANNYNESSDSGPGVEFAYDELNRLAETRDSYGNVIKRLVFDSDSRIIKEIDAKGYLSGATDNARYGTINKYNLAGWLQEKRTPAKLEGGIVYYQIEKYTYDLTGKLLEKKTSPQYVTSSGEPASWNTITYTYYKNGKVKTISDSLGSLMEYTYDGYGNTTSEKLKINSSKDSITNYHYNSMGLVDRMWNEIDEEDLQGGGQGKVNAETFFEYDKNGNIIKVTKPEGYETTFEYDDADRLVARHEKVQEDEMFGKNTTASVVFPTSNIYPGQEYECRIEIHTDSVIKDVEMEVQYDARAFEFIGFTPGVNGILIDGGLTGKVKIRSSGINISADTMIAKIKFKMKEGISGTGYVVIDRGATYTDGAGEKTLFSELTGKSTNIKAPDINGDGKVEADDFTQVALKSGIGRQNPTFDEKYDMNGDGIIDNNDLDYISSYLFSDTQLSNLSKVKYYEKTVNGVCDVNSSTVIRTTTYEYDKAGNLTKETDCDGHNSIYEYDAYNRLISVADKSGAKSRVVLRRGWKQGKRSPS